MKWLTNHHPRNREEPYIQEWLRDKIIGEPKASLTHTVAQLKEMGMVGVYKIETKKEK